jgi:CheY-like chemotaxis protein
VLVVEDNAAVGAFSTQALEELGYRTVLACDAHAALAELDKDAARFDVVFTDVVMPGMNGVELGHEIRRRFPGLPVLLASGYSHVLVQDGAHGFELLHKPYSIEELSGCCAGRLWSAGAATGQARAPAPARSAGEAGVEAPSRRRADVRSCPERTMRERAPEGAARGRGRAPPPRQPAGAWSKLRSR